MAKLVNDELDHPEKGSIEAGLTIIPTTTFFLLAMQLVIAGSFQLIETIDLQSALTRTALFGSEGSEFAFEHARIVQQQNVEIPGGGELLIANSTLKVPIISALAPQDANVSSHVIVVRE